MSPALAHLLSHFGSSLYAYKPSAIATYSAVQWGGARAAINMRTFLAELGCLPVSAMIHVPKAQEVFDEDSFQPIVVFDGDGRLVATVLRPARRPKGAESAAHIRRLIRQILKHWPETRILLRAEGHYATPQVLNLCDRLGLRLMSSACPNTAVWRSTSCPLMPRRPRAMRA